MVSRRKRQSRMLVESFFDFAAPASREICKRVGVHLPSSGPRQRSSLCNRLPNIWLVCRHPPPRTYHAICGKRLSTTTTCALKVETVRVGVCTSEGIYSHAYGFRGYRAGAAAITFQKPNCLGHWGSGNVNHCCVPGSIESGRGAHEG